MVKKCHYIKSCFNNFADKNLLNKTFSHCMSSSPFASNYDRPIWFDILDKIKFYKPCEIFKLGCLAPLQV